MPIFASASMGAVVRLTCPRCGEVQARARASESATYECRKCGVPFTGREGREAAVEAKDEAPPRDEE
jgi:ribosomal protein L37AE/L43A